jgi:hypothetical protein
LLQQEGGISHLGCFQRGARRQRVKARKSVQKQRVFMKRVTIGEAGDFSERGSGGRVAFLRLVGAADKPQ